MQPQPQPGYVYPPAQQQGQYQQPPPGAPLYGHPQQQQQPVQQQMYGQQQPVQQQPVVYQHPPQQPPPVATQQPIMQPVGEAPDPNSSKPWKGGSIAAIVFLAISVLMVIIGLASKTVMDVEYSSGILSSLSIRFSFDYQESKAEIAGKTATGDLDDATCGQAGAVKFAAAVHYFAMFTAIGGISTLSYELATSKTLMGASTALFSTHVGLLFLHSVVLGIVRSNANYDRCDTVPVGLLLYGVGPCWGWCIGALNISFIGLIVYISARHCKCCCYTAPQQQQQVVQVVVQQQDGVQQGAVVQAAPVQGQVVQQPPYQQQQPLVAPPPIEQPQKAA